MLAQAMTASTTDSEFEFDSDRVLADFKKQGRLWLDSRKIRPGDIFLAVPGFNEHGLVYARQAIKQGARAIFFDPAGGGHVLAQDLASDKTISVILMEQPHLKDNIGLLASSFYNHPSHQLKVIGITGTNGKTSCSHFIAQAISGLSDHNQDEGLCGYIGTLGWGVLDSNHQTTNTTPDAVELNTILANLRDQAADMVAMEVSSHGLSQNRLQGVRVTGAVFTNLGRDHLDYHQTEDDYLKAKLKLFSKTGLDFAVINLDDPAAKKVSSAVADGVRMIGFSMQSKNHLSTDQLTIGDIEYHQNHTSVEICFRGHQVSVKVPLLGDFNVENGLATVGVMLGLGFDFNDAVNSLGNLTPVPGRMEKVSCKDDRVTVYVDYAHTPDALKVALQTLKNHSSGRIWVVFGCGGDRDQGKRQQMGEVASRLADHLILTDDNPRYENADQIIDQIISGCSNEPMDVVRDRAAAIQLAIVSAGPGDTVLIAGKGHEVTQEINDQQFPSDDREIAKTVLAKQRNQGRSGQIVSSD